METLRVALGDIAEVTKLAGFEFTKHIEYLPDGEIIAIRGLNVKKGILDLTDIKRISIKASDLLPRSKLFKNDLVLTYTGTIGEVALITEDDRFHLAPNVAVVRPSGVNPYYLYCYMRSRVFKRDFETFSVGSTQKTVPMKNIRQVEIPLLPEKTQIEIGRIISLFDDKIELNQKMNQTLEEIAKAIFKSWFVDFDPVRAKAEGRPTGLPPEISDLFPDELVDSEIGDIPKGWEELVLNQVFTPRNERAGDRDIREFSSTNDGIQPRDAKYKKNLSSSSSKNKVAYKGDFVFGMSREVLNFGLMSDDVGGFSSAYKIYEVSGDYDFSNFIYRQFLSRPQYYYQAVSASSREGQSISQDTLLNLKVLSPTSSVLSTFNSTIAPLIQRCELLLEENHLLSELRDTLLPKLISGELRIPDTEKFLKEAGI